MLWLTLKEKQLETLFQNCILCTFKSIVFLSSTIIRTPVPNFLGKLEKSYSSSNITCDERNEKDCHELPLIDCPKIKVKLAYLANQEKINISIVEAENFFVGRLVYLKVGGFDDIILSHVVYVTLSWTLRNLDNKFNFFSFYGQFGR